MTHPRVEAAADVALRSVDAALVSMGAGNGYDLNDEDFERTLQRAARIRRWIRSVADVEVTGLDRSEPEFVPGGTCPDVDRAVVPND